MSYFQIVKVLFQLSSTLSAPEPRVERGKSCVESSLSVYGGRCAAYAGFGGEANWRATGKFEFSLTGKCQKTSASPRQVGQGGGELITQVGGGVVDDGVCCQPADGG